MSIADEARAKISATLSTAAKHLDQAGQSDIAESLLVLPALIDHLAARKIEAAPSDTDREAAQIIDAELARLAHGELSLEGTPGEWIAQRLVAAGFSRASQPVQVEVTDDMVKNATRVLQCNWDEDDAEYVARVAYAALSAALGGGE